MPLVSLDSHDATPLIHQIIAAVKRLIEDRALRPGTRMPSFWPDGQSPLPDVLDGNATKQMTAIRDYVISIGQPPRPRVASR